MPLIEELPVTATARLSHGWTYIPDTGGPMSAAPLTSRKRARNGTALPTQLAHKLTAKQEKAIQQRLNDLNKENHRDVTIPIPKRDVARGPSRKTTSNVRRILAYSRTFQHYLADEEAGVNVYGAAGNVSSTSSAPAVGHGHAPKADTKKKTAATDGAGAHKTAARRNAKQASATRPRPGEIKDEKTDVDMSEAPPLTQTAAHAHATPSETPATPATNATNASQPLQSHSSPSAPRVMDEAVSDHDPLLQTRDLPKMPSDRLMQMLLAEPPLSYNAARAKPLEAAHGLLHVGTSSGTALPPRWFCAICGYWGKVRCRKGCGERVCGQLECWRGHEASCALAGY